MTNRHDYRPGCSRDPLVESGTIADMTEPQDLEHATGALFGDLWHRYDANLFEESVALFELRMRANGFDLDWLKGKSCLDAGCGGGRYSIALARFGASRVVGLDVSETGLADAARRAGSYPMIEFKRGSVLDLPFADATFDFCWCAGVLHHTADPDRGLAELTRVLKPDGKLFLLLYGKGGLRWPTIMRLRPLANRLGYAPMDAAMKAAGMPANKQRTFLDDLFVPAIAFYDWAEVEQTLLTNGYRSWRRFDKARLDHEASPVIQREELVQLGQCFAALGAEGQEGASIVAAAIASLDKAEADHAAGLIDARERDWRVFGWGHHRLIAEK
jgi:ubiquinone/menaquinone biosynthesis C-methylase UbiE